MAAPQIPPSLPAPQDPPSLEPAPALKPQPEEFGSGDGKALLRQSETAAASFLRGPLRYDVDTSSQQLEAGRTFSVFVRVTNPYESTVTLLDVSASLPAEFRDKEHQDVGVWQSLKQEFKQELKGRIVVAQNVIASRESPVESDLPSAGEILLQHGNSALKRFTLKTWRSTLFTPAAYTLQFQVQYKIDGVLNQDTIREEINIRAPLRAVLWGSFWGAMVGSLLHSLYATQPTQSTIAHLDYVGILTQTLAGILLGGVLVVAFARKKDAQPFISIEDFYGGFFVGFSAGYVGKSLLDRLIR